MTGLMITLGLGCFVLLGALISYMTRENKTIVQISVAIALGTLGTLAILELIPEAVESLGIGKWYIISLAALAGVAFLMVLDRFLPDHGSAESEQYGHSHAHVHSQGHSHSHGHDHANHYAAHIGIISAIAVTLHNVIEGMAVYSMTEQSAMTGLMVALGVGLHNIPMGMVISATLSEKKKERTAMLALASLSTFAGGLFMHLMWGSIGEEAIGILIAVTLGMIIYIVCFELIPMVMGEKKWKITVPGVLIGALVIVVSIMLE